MRRGRPMKPMNMRDQLACSGSLNINISILSIFLPSTWSVIPLRATIHALAPSPSLASESCSRPTCAKNVMPAGM